MSNLVTLLNRLSRDSYDDFVGKDPFFGDLRTWTGPTSQLNPSIEFEEEDEGFRLSMDLPGIHKKDIKVEFSDGAIHIAGERVVKREEKKEGKFYSERSYGQFSRSFRLPEGCDTTHSKAEFADGVLNVFLPKGPNLKTRQLEIN